MVQLSEKMIMHIMHVGIHLSRVGMENNGVQTLAQNFD